MSVERITELKMKGPGEPGAFSVEHSGRLFRHIWDLGRITDENRLSAREADEPYFFFCIAQRLSCACRILSRPSGLILRLPPLRLAAVVVVAVLFEPGLGPLFL